MFTVGHSHVYNCIRNIYGCHMAHKTRLPNREHTWGGGGGVAGPKIGVPGRESLSSGRSNLGDIFGAPPGCRQYPHQHPCMFISGVYQVPLPYPVGFIAKPGMKGHWVLMCCIPESFQHQDSSQSHHVSRPCLSSSAIKREATNKGSCPF